MTSPTTSATASADANLAETQKADEEVAAQREASDTEYLNRSILNPITTVDPFGVTRIVQNDPGTYTAPQVEADPAEVARLERLAQAQEQARKDREAEIAGRDNAVNASASTSSTTKASSSSSSASSTPANSSSTTPAPAGSGS